MVASVKRQEEGGGGQAGVKAQGWLVVEQERGEGGIVVPAKPIYFHLSTPGADDGEQQVN